METFSMHCSHSRPCFRESGSRLRFSYRDPPKIVCRGNKPGQETDGECQSLFSRSNVRKLWEERLAALHPFKGPFEGYAVISRLR